MRARGAAATILLFGAAIASAAALAVALTGGIAFPGFVARSALRPLIAAIVLAGLARAAGTRRDFRIACDRVLGSRARRPRRAALAAAAALLLFAIAWSTRAAGGSDSSCYVLQADAFAHGHAALDNALARILPGAPNAAFAPTGFIPSRDYGVAVPICAPGLALAMAGAALVSPAAIFLVVPAAAAWLVWLTYLYARRLDGDATGACAAALVACSPVVLYQAVQPMSDVPAAAAWTAALVCGARDDDRGAFASGLFASMAVLVRPNLALVAVPLLWLFSAWRRRLMFAAALLPGVAALALLDTARYGSPLSSGYGDAGALFAWAHVPRNAVRYTAWLLETETPIVLFALAAPAWAARHAAARRVVVVSIAGVALLFATYLPYSLFDDWWYLRFLLPAVPIVTALSVTVVRSIGAGRAPAVALVVFAAIGGWRLHAALGRHVTDLPALESRYRLAAAYAARALPREAVLLAVQQSGSIRFHGGRDTLAWDAIPPDALGRVVEELERHGRRVYWALEDVEAPRVRARFGPGGASALDWPPLALVDAPVRVRFYDPRQREVYLRGGRVETELVR